MPLLRSLFWKLCLALVIASLLSFAGCGSGGGPILPHPTGNYSIASLKGQYVYLLHGDSSSGLYREAGVFVADGAGNITSASVDDFSAGSVATNSVSGTYNIAKDGTGFMTLSSTGLGHSTNVSQITLAVTLVSSSRCYLMEADSLADGTGVAELQDSTAIGTIPVGTFVFRLHQIFSNNTAAEVGAVTISSTGSISNGSMDQNLGGISSARTLTGTLNSPASLTGRGTGTFTDNTGSTTDFEYYIVNSGKIVFLVSTSGVVGSGSAEIQTGAVSSGLSGTYAFASRGDDASFFNGLATVGQFTASGATISSGVYDSLQDGTIFSQAVSFTGSPTTSSSNPSLLGRAQITLSTGAVEDFWLVSPSRAFFLTESSSKTEDGTADLQTASSFSTSTTKGQYAMAMDGFDVLGISPEDLARIGTLQFDGAGRLALTEEVNGSNSGSGAINPGALAGTYEVSSNGRIAGSVSNNGVGLTLVMYAVSGSKAYVLQTDSGTNTSGMVELQQ